MGTISPAHWAAWELLLFVFFYRLSPERVEGFHAATPGRQIECRGDEHGDCPPGNKGRKDKHQWGGVSVKGAGFLQLQEGT